MSYNVQIDSDDSQSTDWLFFHRSPLLAIWVNDSWDGTLHLQYSPDKGTNTVDANSFTGETAKIVNVPSTGAWLRVICKSGNYSAGKAWVLFHQ